MNLVGTKTHPVITQVVGKLALLFWDYHANHRFHGVVVPLQHHIHGRSKYLVTKTLRQFNAPFCCCVTRGNQGIQVKPVPLGGAHVV